MAYDEALAARIRVMIAGEPGITEKRMFGGLAFMVRGSMFVAASGRGGIMVRVDPVDSDALLRNPHVQQVEMRGRAMRGWLRVAPEELRTRRHLERWVHRAMAYVQRMNVTQT